MRSITKTIVIAASTIALCFGLTACGGGQSTSSDNFIEQQRCIE